MKIQTKKIHYIKVTLEELKSLVDKKNIVDEEGFMLYDYRMVKDDGTLYELEAIYINTN